MILDFIEVPKKSYKFICLVIVWFSKIFAWSNMQTPN